MKRKEIITLTVLLGIFFAAMSLVSVSAGEGVGVEVDATVNPAIIEPGETTRVGVTLTGSGTSEITFPVDVVLVTDCSGSMDRYGTIIAGTYDVTLSTSYQKMGEFSIAEVADVEAMLQIPVDVYYSKDRFGAYLKNKDTGATSSVQSGYSSTRWYGVQPGMYEVYAKRYDASGTAGRTFAVELPPVRMDSAKDAAKNYVDLMKENDNTALVKFHSNDWSYSSYCRVVQGLTPDKNAVKNKIDALSADGGTPLGEGLKIAIDHLDDQGRSNAVKAIILLTDGWWNMGCDPLDQADRAAEKGYTVYTIGWGGVNVTSLQLIAERTGGRAYFPATSNDLVEIYGELAEELSNITAQNVRLTMELTDEVVYAANPSEEPDWIAGNLLTWDLGTIAVDQLESISFDVEPNAAGTVQINTENSEVTYDDAFGVPQVVPVPQLSVKVIPPESQPVALFTVSNTTPMTNQSIVFDASASYDPDGFIEVYRWDFENDGVVDIEGNVVTITHSYTTNGTKTAKLEVVDNIGASDWVTKEITVTDGAGEAISGNVTWSGKHLFEGLGNREVIGNTVHIKATAYEITNNGDEDVTVTVELRVDGIPLTSTTATLGPYEQKPEVIVYGEWVPMASGMHHISLHVYDGEYWVPPTNDPTAGVKVFIEKVI